MTTPVIIAHDISLTFKAADGPVHALKDVNLTINHGEFVAREPRGTVNQALSAWKELTAPRPVERSGISATGV